METQLKKVSKDELHKIIDEISEDELMVLTYRKDTGISDIGKKMKKKKTKILVDKATILILTDNKPIRRVDLEGNFSRFSSINRNIIKSILLPQTHKEQK